MADNTTLNSGTGGDTIRTVAKTANSPAKTGVTVLDVGGGADGDPETPLKAGTAGSAATTVLSVQGVAGGTAQPISAASLPLPAGAALEAGGNLAATAAAAGTTADAAYAGSGAATIIGALKGLYAKLAGTLATSRTWTLASGTDTVTVAQATAANLNATVTGTVTANLGTLNGAATASGLTTINTTLGSPFQAGGSIGNSSFGATQSGAWSVRLQDGGGTAVTSTTDGAKQRLDVTLASAAVPGSAAPAYVNMWGITDGTNARTALGNTAGNMIVGSLSERWVAGAGQGLTWGSAFGSEVNSLATGNAILSSVTIANGTAKDTYADVSVSIASITTGSGAPYLGLYLYPLNQDGSTYGDGRFISAAAGPPLSGYYVGQIPLVPSVTQSQTGAVTGIVIPPGSFKLVLYNLAGVVLAASSNTISYRTYNRAFA